MSKMKLGNHKATNTALDALKKPAGATRKLQMNIPEELHLAFKLACVEDGVDMTQVNIELIQNWLKSPNL